MLAIATGVAPALVRLKYADDIRRFRQTALAAPEDDALRRILDFGDFYTLSNCRDLLFHAHEQHVGRAEPRRLRRPLSVLVRCLAREARAFTRLANHSQPLSIHDHRHHA